MEEENAQALLETPKRKKIQRGKGRYCVAYGCTSSSADNISFHLFPRVDKRPEIRKQWIAFVKSARKDFDNPSGYMCLCEKHFEDSCYPMKYRVLKSAGKGDEIKQKTLLPDAIPTIHLHRTDQPGTSSSSGPQGSQTSRVKSKTSSRTAFRKRECARIIQDYTYEQEISFSASSMETSELIDCESDNTMNMQTRGTQFKGFKVPRRSIAIQSRPKVRSIDVQTDARMIQRTVSVATQCNMEFAEYSGHILYPSSSERNIPTRTCSTLTYQDETQKKVEITGYEQASSDVDIQSYCDRSSDLDFVMSSEEEEEDYDICEDGSNDGIQGRRNAATEPKYVVFQSNLLSLFATCPSCRGPTSAQIYQQVGSMVCICQECTCGYLNKWYSQPYIGNTPAGNLLISASILFSGLPPTKALRFLDHMNVKTISRRTFDNHQSLYLHPTVLSVWKAFQEKYFHEMREKQLPLSVGGDGRADSPGHCAKFGSYTLIDLNFMAVIDVQLVQSNEVKSSTHMELEGLKRCVAKMKSEELSINEIVSDRHVQINKYIRENMPNTTHYFDVWHVAKGLKKKLTAMSKLKECDAISPWIRSITNHMYWVPASTPDGHEETMTEKWMSVLSHIQNVHTMNGKYFTRCEHDSLEGRERRKKWIQPGTKAYEKLQDLLTSRQVMKDVKKLSPGAQTSCLEAFHAVVNHFAPKLISFSYHGMQSRLLLAALHYNENGQRDQAYTKDGEKRSCIVFPKYKKGDYTVRDIKVNCTFGYVHKLFETLLQIVEDKASAPSIGASPPPLSSQYKRPRIEDIQRVSRY